MRNIQIPDEIYDGFMCFLDIHQLEYTEDYNKGNLSKKQMKVLSFIKKLVAKWDLEPIKNMY